jgi:MFS family permease
MLLEVGMFSDRFGRKSALCLSIMGAITSYLGITMATSIPLLFIRFANKPPHHWSTVAYSRLRLLAAVFQSG